MSTELTCLVINALWGLVLVFVEVGGKTKAAGATWNAGNRESDPSFPPWVERAGRALANHKENFPLFLTAVIVVTLTHKADATSAAAAIVYVVARVLHALCYIVGVKGIRSAFFSVGLVATLVLFSRLVT